MSLVGNIKAAVLFALSDHVSVTGDRCRERAATAVVMGRQLSAELWTAAAGASFDVMLSLQAAACEELGGPAPRDIAADVEFRALLDSFGIEPEEGDE